MLATRIARRFAAAVILLLVLSMAAFALQYVAPGGIERAILGDNPSTPELLQAIRDEYHLDEPLPVQYALWLEGALRLDFGTSIRTHRQVVQELREHVQVSALLVLYGFLLTMSVGVLLGVTAALARGTATDRSITFFALIGASAPAFVTSIFLIYIFGVVLRWLPVFGQGDGFLDQLRHLTLPAAALAFSTFAIVVKLTRAEMITVLERDFITFARARGISPARVLWVHGLRNALNPVVSSGAITFARMLFGTVLVEVTFGLPGLGSLILQTANNRDVPMMQALVLLIGIIIVMVNMAADLLYLAVNPRLRFARAFS